MNHFDIDGNQLKAARVLLGLSSRDLAVMAGVCEATIKALEKNGLGGQFGTIQKVLRALDTAGVSFPRVAA